MTYTVTCYRYPDVDTATEVLHTLHAWAKLYRADAFVQAMFVDGIDGAVIVFGMADADVERCMHKFREDDLRGGEPVEVGIDIVMAAEALHARNKDAHDFSQGELELVEEQFRGLVADGTTIDFEPADEDEE